MSKKHFDALAAALRSAFAHEPQGGITRAQWERDVHAIADACAAASPRFDRARFIRACGAR